MDYYSYCQQIYSCLLYTSNRCIWKKLPGAGYVEMVYDNADRLVFSQDGNQRALTSGNGTYYKYDVLNRLTEQGRCV